MNRPFAGNIEFALGETNVLPASLVYSSRGFSGARSLITFEDGLFEVSPTQWEAADIEYDYESVSFEPLHKVKTWRPFWNIRMKYADKDIWATVCRSIMSLMNKTGHTFSASGVSPVVQFWFYPPGDRYRPRIEVVLAKRSTDMDEYFGGRYIGFGQFEIAIRGRQTYDEQHIPIRYLGFPALTAGIIAPVGSILISEESL